MEEPELSAILGREERHSIAFLSGDIAAEREDALKRYYGELYGNEEDGQSKVVMRDVQDVVEWLLPALLKIFTSGDQVVEYQPRGPEDEQAAKQRTEFINYIFQQDNNAFLILYTVFKDALIQKNGVAKVYYDKSALDETRTVTGIDDDAYTLLLNDPDIEIIAHSEVTDGASPSGVEAGPLPPETAGAVGAPPGPPASVGDAFQAPPMAPANQPAPMPGPMAPQPPAMLHDVKYTKRGGKVCVELVAPEKFLIASRAIDIASSPYCGDRRRKTISDLLSEGYTETTDGRAVKDLPGDSNNALSGEEETRRTVPEDDGDTDFADREDVMREVWVTDHYILVDFDGDGIAERRRVVTVGATTNILLNEEWEGPPPYASGSPILVPHRVIGQSIADQVSDLQLINTTIMRQMLDNLYRTNHPRYAGQGVDIDDWYSPRVGQLVGVQGNPNDALKEITVPFTAGASLPVLEYIATVRENRTGVTRYNQGIDANSLNKTASGITQIMSAAQQRVELIARILAETFMKPLFGLIDHCATKYMDKARVVRIRGQWVSVDPRQWESNYDMTINVGLGTGNKDQMLMHLQTILGMQAQVIQMQGGVNGPLVTLDNVHHALTKLTENSGFKNAEAFWTDPKQAQMEPQPPPPPDPAMVKVQQDGEIEMAKLQQKAKTDEAELALKASQSQVETQIKWTEMNANLRLKEQQMQGDRALAVAQQQEGNSMARDKMNGDQQLAREKQNMDGAEQLAGRIEPGLKSLAESVQQSAEQTQQVATQLQQQMAQLAELISAEREVIRDASGRAQGVRIKARMN